MHLTPRAWVVKIGGRLCEDDTLRPQLAAACAAALVPLILVHGGGAQVTRIQEALGQVPQFVDGRRVTDATHMQAVEMVLSGSMNKLLVRALLKAGTRAVGLSGVDDQMVRACLLPGLGAVGVPHEVRPELLQTLLQAGYLPVLSPVSLGPQGEPVNVNADEFACKVAQAVQAERLLLLSDVPAVQVGGQAQTTLLCDNVEDLIMQGEVKGGMVPKLRSAVLAVRAGVTQVCIAGFAASLHDVRGTTVVAQ
jgi:acetylglutamate kinase